MKKIINLIAICMLVSAPLLSIQATKSPLALKKTIGINIYNGTGVNGSIWVSGPTSFSATLYPGANNFGPVTPGNYTVILYSTSAPHTYNLMGQVISNSTGSATFYPNITVNYFGSVN